MKKKIFQFSSVMFLMYVSHGLLYPQIIPFLTEVGYSASERGLILSFFALVSMIGQIVVGYLSDKYSSTRRFFIFGTIIFLGASFGAFQVSSINFGYHFLIMGMMAGFIRILSNLYETWVLEVDGLFDSFSFIRSFGSLGWALASLASGYLIHSLGYVNLSYISGFFSILVIFSSFKLEDAMKQNNEVSHEPLKISDISILLKNKRYVMLIIIYTLTYFVFNADATTITDYMFILGGTPQDVGVKWFVQAMSEIPIMLIGGYILKRWGAKRIMVFASILMVVRMITYGMATNISQIIILSLLQSITFPLILISQKDLIFKESPRHLRSTAQMLSISITIGFSAILTPLVSGFLIDATSIHTAIYTFAAIMIIPTILIIFFEERHTN